MLLWALKIINFADMLQMRRKDNALSAHVCMMCKGYGETSRLLKYCERAKKVWNHFLDYLYILWVFVKAL